MNPLAPTAAAAHHPSTANFLFSVPSDLPRLLRDQPRTRGLFFLEVTRGQER